MCVYMNWTDVYYCATHSMANVHEKSTSVNVYEVVIGNVNRRDDLLRRCWCRSCTGNIKHNGREQFN